MMQWQVLDWQLDSRTREVTGPAGSERLRPKVYRVFRLLLEKAPAVVSKVEIVDVVWGGRRVSDSAIAQVIRELRALLGDDPAAPRIIATRHRQGYQCIATVEAVDGDRDGSCLDPAPSHADVGPIEVSAASRMGRGASPWRLRAMVGLTVGLLIVVGANWPRKAEGPMEIPSSGWPTHPRAMADLAQGLHASRLLQSAEALRHLEAVAAIEDTPRLQAQRARLLLRQGRRSDAESLVGKARAQAPGLERAEQLMTEAVAHELDGQLAAAGKIYTVLTSMFPDDADHALAWLDTVPALATEAAARWLDNREIPAERRLLLAAKAAGQARDPEGQRSRAEATLLASEGSAPAISALARKELATALYTLGDVEGSHQESLQAAEDLLALGEARDAFYAWRQALGRTSDPFTLQKILRAFEADLGSPTDPFQQAELTVVRGRLEVLRRNYSASLPLFELAARRFADLGFTLHQVNVRRFQAGSLLHLGQIEEAQRLLLEAIREAEAQGTPAILGTAFNTLANISVQRGQPDIAVKYYERAFAEYQRDSNTRGQLLVLVNLSSTKVDQGKLDEALASSAEALVKARELGDTRRIASVLYLRARCQLALGDLAAGLELIDEALAAAREVGHTSFEVGLLLHRNVIHRYRAELAQAEAAWGAAAALQVEDAKAQGMLAYERGWLERELGRPSEARERLERFHRDHPEMGGSDLGLALGLLQARLDLDSGRAVEVEQNLGGLLDRAGHSGHALLRRDAHILLGEALAAQGKIRAASEQLDTARKLLDTAPDFRARLALALARAQLERIRAKRLADPYDFSRDLRISDKSFDDGRRRLSWAAETAAVTGFRLQELEARVELLGYGDSTAEAREALLLELEKRGLVRLQRRLDQISAGGVQLGI